LGPGGDHLHQLALFFECGAQSLVAIDEELKCLLEVSTESEPITRTQAGM